MSTPQSSTIVFRNCEIRRSSPLGQIVSKRQDVPCSPSPPYETAAKTFMLPAVTSDSSSSYSCTSPTASIESPGATVFVGSSNTATVHAARLPEVCESSAASHWNQPAHVVKIKINSNRENDQVVSSVRINHSHNLLTEELAPVNCDYPRILVNSKVIANGNYTKSQEFVKVNEDECKSLKSANENCNKQQCKNQGHRNEMFQACTVPESYFYYASPLNAIIQMPSGQAPPSETLDSETCSDLDGTPPPLLKKKLSNSNKLILGRGGTGSLTSSGAEIDSDDEADESNLSFDSLNGTRVSKSDDSSSMDAVEASLTSRIQSPTAPLVTQCSYEERFEKPEVLKNYRCYNFHLNEKSSDDENTLANESDNNENNDESFAGYKILQREAIRSAKGTIRGVKNRVRAGIATFLQTDTFKNYKIKDAGKIVVYTTTMGVVRETYYRCVQVKQILRTHMVKYEERDMYLSSESQKELKERLGLSAVHVPQLFIDGQYIGDADAVERLNESGELRAMLRPYKSRSACATCQLCGGFSQLPCPVCNGSKKSIHRNNFTVEFTALKCMHCNEVGLIKCPNCKD